MGAALPIVGALGGALGGLAGQQKEGGLQVPGTINLSPQQQQQLSQSAFGALQGITPATSSGAEQAVQSSPIFGQLFGQGGELGKTIGEEQRLATQGFKLQPEDIEAYGQGAGNIARMFGQQEQGLSQALAQRGLGQSGVAAQQFSGLQGNKGEQLAQLQMNIANQRMQNNLARLGQTRQFLQGLGSQAQSAVQGEYGREAGTNEQALQKAQGIGGLLGQQYGQQANSAQLERATQHESPFASALGGALGGGFAGYKTMSGMSGGGSSGGLT